MKLAVAAAAVAVALLVAAALAGVGRPDPATGETQKPEHAVTVNGLGEVETVPDEAQLSVGVTTQAETARAAADANAEKMNAVIAALREAGIDEKDIQTQNISLEPQFRRNAGIYAYRASNTVAAKSGLEELAAALDAAVEAGATQTYGISLSRSDQEKLYRDALADAVDDAKAKAQALAKAGDFDLGGVIRVQEGGTGLPFAAQDMAVSAEMRAQAPIAPGTQKVTANVAVTFALE